MLSFLGRLNGWLKLRVAIGCEPSRSDLRAHLHELWWLWKSLSALLEKHRSQCGFLQGLASGALFLLHGPGIGGAMDAMRAGAFLSPPGWGMEHACLYLWCPINAKSQPPTGEQGHSRGLCLAWSTAWSHKKKEGESQRRKYPEQGAGRGEWCLSKVQITAWLRLHSPKPQTQLRREQQWSKNSRERAFPPKTCFWCRRSYTDDVDPSSSVCPDSSLFWHSLLQRVGRRERAYLCWNSSLKSARGTHISSGNTRGGYARKQQHEVVNLSPPPTGPSPVFTARMGQQLSLWSGWSPGGSKLCRKLGVPDLLSDRRDATCGEVTRNKAWVRVPEAWGRMFQRLDGYRNQNLSLKIKFRIESGETGRRWPHGQWMSRRGSALGSWRK